jgi:hypothetical protein
VVCHRPSHRLVVAAELLPVRQHMADHGQRRTLYGRPVQVATGGHGS